MGRHCATIVAWAAVVLLVRPPAAAAAAARAGDGAALQLRAKLRSGQRRQQQGRTAGASQDSSGAAFGVPPVSVLLMSSPVERKVSYALIQGGQVLGDGLRPLVDAGLETPDGLAYHSGRGALFVADRGQQKIFRYSLRVSPCAEAQPGDGDHCGGLSVQVTVTGVQATMVQDVMAGGLAVDSAGNLYFTDETQRSVNRLDAAVIKRILDGYADVRNMPRIAERESAALAGSGQGPKEAIVVLYEAGSNANIGVPAGISTDGLEVTWANSEDGRRCGSIAAGPAKPDVPPAAQAGTALAQGLAGWLEAPADQALPAPSTKALSTDADAAEGVALLPGVTIFTGKSQNVYGVCKGGAVTTVLSNAFSLPRGLAWDGDSTVYVADSGVNVVFSMPTGRCREKLPLQHVVDFHQVSGLALIRASDRALAAALAQSGGAAAADAADAAGAAAQADQGAGWAGELLVGDG